MKKLYLASLLLAVLPLAACNDPYGASAKANEDIATSITQGMKTVQQIQSQGLLSTTEALNVLGYLEFANQANEAFGACVGAAHTGGNKPGTYTACAQTFNTTLNTPAQLALIHVSNTTAEQDVTVIVNGFTTGVAALETALGGA